MITNTSYRHPFMPIVIFCWNFHFFAFEIIRKSWYTGSLNSSSYEPQYYRVKNIKCHLRKQRWPWQLSKKKNCLKFSFVLLYSQSKIDQLFAWNIFLSDYRKYLKNREKCYVGHPVCLPWGAFVKYFKGSSTLKLFYV